MNKNDRILGALFGVACGDALGGTLEFLNKEEGKEKYGYLKNIIGGGFFNLKPGEVTDDTMMTLAVAKGILNNPKDPIEEIGREFIKWYNTNPKDIGDTCSYSIARYLKSRDWSEAALYTHKSSYEKSAGNGSLMRCIPVALYYNDYNEMIEITVKQSKMTHYDDTAASACVLYNTLAYKFLRGEDKLETIKNEIAKYNEYKDVLEISKGDLKPTGFVVDSLKCALWCFIYNDNLEDIICEAVNLCGDADTIGAVAGGLAGVYYGYENIPDRWKRRILIKQHLNHVGKEYQNSEFRV